MAGLVLADTVAPPGGGISRRTDAVATLSAAMAVGRLIGAVIEGEADGVTRVFIALEAATAAALVVGARAV